MTQFDVCLVGNLIVDSTYCVSNFAAGQSNKSLSHTVSVGSIANVLRTLRDIAPDLKVSICSSTGEDPDGRYISEWLMDFKNGGTDLNVNIDKNEDCNTSTALIISDVAQNIRSSIVRWGACAKMNNFEIPPSSWTHIMYADKLDNLNIDTLSSLRKGGIISMDFCLGSHSTKEVRKINAMLSYIDYAILSVDEAMSITRESDAAMATKKIGKLVSQYAIIHSPKHVYVSDGADLQILDTDFVDNRNMNVLGAGDMFAAATIAKTIQNPDVMENALFAHQYTTKKLMESYGKEI
jgi:sugar/nucleoside kinase (ribokinase family)